MIGNCDTCRDFHPQMAPCVRKALEENKKDNGFSTFRAKGRVRR